MDTIASSEIAEHVLTSILQQYSSNAPFRTIPVFDRASGNYLLMDEGWDKYRRIHRVWAHIEVRDGMFWIHEDGTEIGIANRLIEAGVARERIVLAFQDPVLRQASQFATA